MADIIDAANDLADAYLRDALALVPKPVETFGVGECLCCGIALSNRQQRWCDADCRDIYLRHNPEPQRRLPERGFGLNARACFGDNDTSRRAVGAL